MTRILLFAIGVLAIAAVLLFLPVRLPYAIEAPGKILPQREWVLVRGQDGCLMSTLYNRVMGSVEAYEVRQIERGDDLTFRQHPSIVAGASVAAGDTVGVVHSLELRRRLARLQGELASELAALSLNRAGQKASVVQEAQQRLVHAQAQAEQQRRQLERLQALLKRDAISREELEIAEDQLKLYEIQIDVEKAQLSSVQTGARQQQVDWVRSRISALHREMEVLERKQAASTLTVPVSGRVARCFSADTLVVVQDTTGYVVILPVKWIDRDRIALRQLVMLNAGSVFHVLQGTVEQLGNTAHVVGREQVFGVTAILDPRGEALAPGLIVRCTISCDPVRPFEYMRRIFTE